MELSTWRTDDMALAAFLSLVMDEEPDLEWEMSSCYFVFPETDDLLDNVSDFVSDDARVEPRLYNMAFAKLKKAVFNHPDAPQPGSWKRGRTRAATA